MNGGVDQTRPHNVLLYYERTVERATCTTLYANPATADPI